MSDQPTIFLGSHGDAVRVWQRAIGVEADGDFGPVTEDATKRWQAAHGVEADGVVGPVTWAAAQRAPTEPPPAPTGLEGIPLVLARHFTRHDGPRKVDLLVIHTMEAPERAGTARAVAQWFASAGAPEASAHFCVDSGEIVQCVREDDVAWHAGRVNGYSIGIEHAGYARQTAAEWADEYSKLELANSARLAAVLCARHGIPVRRLTPAQIRHRERGICGHMDITAAWQIQGGHVDPGPAFPWSAYIETVEHALRAIRETKPDA